MLCESLHIPFVENEFATYRIASRLLHLDFKPQVYLDLSAAHLIVADRLRLQEGRAYYVVCDTSGVCGTTKAARDHLCSSGSELVKAIAFVTDSKLAYSKLILYLSHHLTPVPTKIFFDRSRAVDHLSSL